MGAVSFVRQRLSNGGYGIAEAHAVRRESVLPGSEAGQQACSRRHANRIVAVGCSEISAYLRELINVGRANIWIAVSGKRCAAHLIYDEDQEIWRAFAHIRGYAARVFWWK